MGQLYIYKNAILLHHIEIGKLFGVDFGKIKSIARAKTTVAKIHSSTVTLSPLHLLYTRYVMRMQSCTANALSLSLSILTLVFFSFSNEWLHTHRVMVMAPAVLAGSLTSTVPRYFQSQVKLTGKK